MTSPLHRGETKGAGLRGARRSFPLRGATPETFSVGDHTVCLRDRRPRDLLCATKQVSACQLWFFYLHRISVRLAVL